MREYIYMDLYGGIEAGGTKFVCGVGSGNGELLIHKTFETATPDETLSRVCEFFNKNKVEAIGIGSFGPLNLNKASQDYGTIISSSKPGWQGVNIFQEVGEKLKIRAAIVTDTDSAVIGEQFYGKGVGLRNIVYITVGTGVGGSVIIDNDVVHGISHPEMGHIIIPTDGEEVGTKSGCSYHTSCLEALASGKSLEIRHGKNPAEITDEAVWDLEAKRLAYGLVNVISFIQPQKIIIGGGVIKTPGLLEKTHDWVLQHINGYFTIPKIEKYIVKSSSDTIGVLGSIKLAEQIQNIGS